MRKMKKIYFTPLSEILKVSCVDIIQTSGLEVIANPNGDDDRADINDMFGLS